MKNTQLMDFSVDKENKQIHVKREFAASRDRVWAAWTQPELLDQWWAPKPWKAETKTMDFREGGHWLYAMKGPEGEVHWSRANYISITPQESFTGKDGFCDEEGNMNTSLPLTFWENQFNEVNDSKTLVTVQLTFEALSDLEVLINMGFQEGFTAGLENLDQLLESQVA